MARENRRKRLERRFGAPERLADMILDGKLTPLFPIDHVPKAYEAWQQEVKRLIGWLERSPVIECQNVYDYCINSFGGKDVDYEKDIPCYMLPFSPMFLEFTGTSGSRFGYIACVFGGDGYPSPPSEIGDFLIENPGSQHIIFSEIFVLRPGTEKVQGPAVCVMVAVDSLGKLVGSPRAVTEFSKLLSPEAGVTIANSLRHTFFPTFMTIAFMHCKNVVLSHIDPDPTINRERRKAGMKPFVRYHTINIEPMKKVLKTEGNIETEGLKKALHICRGHFATYSEEKPLFGKVAGTFWVPSHTRGSLKQGYVVSDYNVKAPAPPSGPQQEPTP